MTETNSNILNSKLLNSIKPKKKTRKFIRNVNTFTLGNNHEFFLKIIKSKTEAVFIYDYHY